MRSYHHWLGLGFGLVFQPAPLALMALTWSLRSLSLPFVPPLWPHAKRVAPLALCLGLHMSSTKAPLSTLKLMCTLLFCGTAAIWAFAEFFRWQGRVSRPIVASSGNREVCAHVIFLHGLGGTAASFAGLEHACTPPRGGVCWHLPSAPVRSMTVDWGLPRASWFDIIAVAASSQQPHVLDSDLDQGIQNVDEIVSALIHSGVPSQRIFIAGFSQGGALALATAFKSLVPLGGIAVFSGFLPILPELQVPACRPNMDCPVLWCHGDADVNVPIHLMHDGVRQLQRAGFCCITAREHVGLGHDMQGGDGMATRARSNLPGMVATPLTDFRTWLGSHSMAPRDSYRRK